MDKIDLTGPNAFYKAPDYFDKTVRELLEPAALPECHYRFETESKVWRVVKIIFAILIPLIGLAWGLHALVGKVILPVPFYPKPKSFCDMVRQAIYDSSRSREMAQELRGAIVNGLNSSWKVKRLAIEVNGSKIDALIIGKPSTLNNGRWVLQSVGNGDLYESHLLPDGDHSTIGRMLKELKGNALLFNYPGKGASEGFRERSTVLNTYRAMLNFLEDKQKGLTAQEIVLYGHSIGTLVQGEVLATHELKKDIRYVAVKDRPPADLSSAAKGMMGGCAGFALKVFGWNMSSVESSKKLQCPEVILQTMPIPQKEKMRLFNKYGKDWVDFRHEIPNNYHPLTHVSQIDDDGVITAEASLTKRLLQESNLSNKKIVGMYEWHNDAIFNWKPICNIINSNLNKTIDT